MKLTKHYLNKIIREEIQTALEVVEEDFGSPGQPDWEKEAAVIGGYPETPDLAEGIRVLLEKWPDKQHPYYQDLLALYTQFTTG